MGSNAKLGLGAAALLLLVGGLVWWLAPPAKVSRAGYDLAMPLMSACNRKDVNQLRKVDELIQSSLASGELPEKDSKKLSSIVDLAKSGKWDKASRAVRQLMEDQVQPAR